MIFFIAVISEDVQHIIAGEDVKDASNFLTRFYGELVYEHQLEEVDPEELGGEVALMDQLQNDPLRRFVI